MTSFFKSSIPYLFSILISLSSAISTLCIFLEAKKYPNIIEIIMNAPVSTAKVIHTATNAYLSYERE